MASLEHADANPKRKLSTDSSPQEPDNDSGVVKKSKFEGQVQESSTSDAKEITENVTAIKPTETNDKSNPTPPSEEEGNGNTGKAPKYMNPPWIHAPDVHPFEIGWRMGSLESYMMEFGSFYEKLDTKEQEDYQTKYPPPKQWKHFYEGSDYEHSDDEDEDESDDSKDDDEDDNDDIIDDDSDDDEEEEEEKKEEN